MPIAVPIDIYRIEDTDEVELILSSRRWVAGLAAFHVVAFVVADVAEGLAELIADGLGLPRVDALGASFGGRWLLDAAARHPARFAHLVLANTFARSAEVSRHPLFDIGSLQQRGPEETKAAWAVTLDASPRSELRDLQRVLLEEQPAAVLHHRLMSVATAPDGPDLDERLGVGIIECADDPLIPPDTQADLRRRISGAAIVRLRTGGHYPHVVAVQAYVAALRGILAGPSDARPQREAVIG
ncbi:alpha/beta hydrolase [Leptolyngbya sp. 15MV]|nr:alpha/beta hydrolase [Leptolyngbya sp. 15MV]